MGDLKLEEYNPFEYKPYYPLHNDYSEEEYQDKRKDIYSEENFSKEDYIENQDKKIIK